MDDDEMIDCVARAIAAADGWAIAPGVDLSKSINPRAKRLRMLAIVAIEAMRLVAAARAASLPVTP